LAFCINTLTASLSATSRAVLPSYRYEVKNVVEGIMVKVEGVVKIMRGSGEDEGVDSTLKKRRHQSKAKAKEMT
jgi:DNA/RNA endonuclease YhcR with UshA esterase domain